jgi:hypothetical protein
MNLLISLFDHSGNASRPYMENGWKVVQVDIKHGVDIMEWDYNGIAADKIGIICMQPCTAYANSGNRHKASRLADGQFEYHQKLVAKSKEIIDYFNPFFWQLENQMTDIHKKNPWIGQRPKLVFDPCDFAGYDPVPDNSRYNKKTWLFGKFNDPVSKRLEPLSKANPGWSNLGGKSERTKELRSITPLGFAYAFYEANH